MTNEPRLLTNVLQWTFIGFFTLFVYIGILAAVTGISIFELRCGAYCNGI